MDPRGALVAESRLTCSWNWCQGPLLAVLILACLVLQTWR